MDNNPNCDVNSLRSQMQYLHSRIHELEAENAKLSKQLSNCACKKTTGSGKTSTAEASHLIEEIKNQKFGNNDVAVGLKKKLSDTGTIHHLPKRHVALKVMYFGPRFYGFASEAQMDPTVESEIFKALKQTRLIFGDKKELKYSRCGRTDKGVSSVGQVISLFLRSNLRVTTTSAEHSAEMPIKESCCEEIDYVKILNRVLPKDIRITGWSPASVDFSARFSCLSREYKYFFWRENLDIRAMEIASEKFIGEHDFRNFCKMDAANVHNYKRRIMLFEIFPCSEMYQGDQLLAMKVKGSAFLWHQVRCMVAVLFLIGEGLESPEVIDALLDIKATPRKPQYAMAPEIPLVLESCEFEGLKFMCSIDARKVLINHLEKECREYKLKAAIFHEALLSCCNDLYDYNQLNIRRRKKKSAHIPLMSRPTELSYEERSSKLKVGRGAKNEEIHAAPDIHAKQPTV